MAHRKPKPSFSPYRKWGIAIHVGLLLLLVLSVLTMLNYLSRDYYLRIDASTHSKRPLSSRTTRFVESITNNVRIIVYYDRNEPLFSTVTALLHEYKLLNSKLSVRVVDYVADPAGAQEIQAKYPFLAAPNAKNVIIFDCEGRVKPVDGGALTKYVLEQVPSEKEREFRRKPTTFEGEKAFTSTLLAVISPKPLKAYFLRGHGEHEIDSADENVGYLKFASLLAQNYIRVEKLSLLGTNTVPMDCSLLVIAGPTTAIPEFELKKVEQYLDDGGRLLAMFNVLSLSKGDTGLEKLLSRWNVNVSTNVVKDPEHSMLGSDVVVSSFNKQHPIVNPLLQMQLHMILPRAVGRLQTQAQGADGIRVEELAFSGPKSEISNRPSGETRQAYPLMVAVEKAAIKAVITERGTTRMVIIGDSIFLANHQIDSAANRDFASYAVNWLLDRGQLMEGVGPRPVIEYRLVMTQSQLRRAQWLLLAVFPGVILISGALVSFRRRK